MRTALRLALAREIRATKAGRNGPTTRIISPEEISDRLKPFLDLDYFNAAISPGAGFPPRQHSGEATLTWQPNADVHYRDRAGEDQILKAGGLEWMIPGPGASHQRRLVGEGLVAGFQLWVPAPPEGGASSSQYIPPEEVPKYSAPGVEAKVFRGALGDGASPVVTHLDMNYFAVFLAKGAKWLYEPPPSHDVAFAFAFEGEPTISGGKTSQEILAFSDPGGIALEAPAGPCAVLIGSAAR
jgi:redox-sensitive bicupin YhaK (pirin superfamily)